MSKGCSGHAEATRRPRPGRGPLMGARAFRPPKRQRTGRTLINTEVMTLEAALADPALEGGTIAALMAAGLSYPGSRMSECVVCLEPWEPGRGPCLAMVTHLRRRDPRDDEARIGFLCPDCAAGPTAEVWGRVRSRMLADYPDVREGTLVSEGGRA